MKKKKLLIIIIIVVVVLVGAFLALMFTGILPFGPGAGESDSSEMSSSASMTTSGSMAVPMSGSMPAMSGSMASVSGSMAAASGTTTTVVANPDRFFEGEYYFQNITGVALTEIQIAPAGTASWESNLLGETALENGETWALPLMLRDLGGTWDLRTTDANGQELLYTGLDFYANSKFVLTLEGENPSLRQAP